MQKGTIWKRFRAEIFDRDPTVKVSLFDESGVRGPNDGFLRPASPRGAPCP